MTEIRRLPDESAGRSLAQDAWRRLRRDAAAMAALVALAAVGGLALLTPLLPLQPPDRDRTDLQYAAPTVTPLWLHDFVLDEELIARTPHRVAALRAEIAPLRAAYEAARRQLARAAAELSSPALSQEERASRLATRQQAVDAAFEALYRKYAEIDDTVQLPYSRAGYAELGPASRWLVRMRHRLFGAAQLNSVCGRDMLGRDVLSRILWGARVSLLVGLVATLVSLAIGVTYGAVAGYVGGRIDNAMMRVVDVLYSIPFIFVVIFIITVLNEDRVAHRLSYYGVGKMTAFYLCVGAVYWLTMARVVRGQVISLKNEPFVEAAKSLGASRRRILYRHILPNIASVVLVYLTLTIPRVMLSRRFCRFWAWGSSRRTFPGACWPARESTCSRRCGCTGGSWRFPASRWAARCWR